MTEMVERVSRKIGQILADSGYGPTHELLALIARAAIFTMREPTEEMLTVAACSFAKRDWQTMIDEALK